MPMPSPQQVAQDPDFWKLPESERIKVMARIDNSFKALADNEKIKAMAGLNKLFIARGSAQGTSEEKSQIEQQIPDEMITAHKPFQPSPKQQQNLIQKSLQAMSPIYRPALEAGGAAGGAIAAAPANIIAPGVSSVLGGGLGFAGGKSIADRLDEYAGIKQAETLKGALTTSAEDIRTGMTMEMGGQALIPIARGGKWIFKAVKDPFAKAWTKSGAIKHVREVLSANTSSGEIIARNAMQAKRLERDIPGLKFTYGQRTNDPGAIKLERAQMRKPGVAAEMNNEQIANNDEAIRNYFQKSFGGIEGTGQVISLLESQKNNLKRAADEAIEEGYRAALKTGPVSPQETGATLLSDIKSAKEPVKRTMDELERGIPDYPMRLDNVRQTIDELLSSKKLSIGQRRSIGSAKNAIDTVLKQGGESTHSAFGVRRTLNEQIDKAFARGEDKSAAVLLQVKDGLENDLSVVSGMARSGKVGSYRGKPIETDQVAEKLENLSTELAGMRARGSSDMDVSALSKRVEGLKRILSETEPGKDVASAMRAYNQFASNKYFARFDRGVLPTVTARGKQAITQTRIAPERIAGYFTTPSGSDDLVAAIGKEKAGTIMKGHYSYSMLRESTNETTGKIIPLKLRRWLGRNADQLEKFGIKPEFESVARAQDIADAAEKASVDFENGAIKRFLGADPEKAIAAALIGNRTGKSMSELVSSVKNDPAALAGLKNAFANHLIDSVQKTAKDIARKPTLSNAAINRVWKKYRPAIKELYKNEPEKVQALRRIQKAYEVMASNTYSPIGGGSDSAENIFAAIANAPILNWKVTAARGIYKKVKRFGQRELDDMLTRALFDPDYAETVIKISENKIKPSEFERVVGNRIIKLDDYRRNRQAASAAGAFAAVHGAVVAQQE